MSSYGVDEYGAGVYGGSGVGAGSVSTVVPLVQAELLIEWSTNPTDALSIATNDADLTVGVIASSDDDTGSLVITEPEYTAGFGGPNDDLSPLLATGSCSRGRNDDLSQMQGAQAQFTLRDANGFLNYANPASPLYGEMETRMHPARWRLARNGAWTSMFWGYTETIQWQPGGRNGVTVITCTDIFYRLSRDKPTIASLGPTTTGAAINAILDAIDWPADPASRSIDPGDNIPDFSADGTQDCLTLIAGLLNAAQGIFFIRGDGIPVFEDRYAPFLKTPVASIVDVMSNVEPTVDFTPVRNRVTVERTDFAGNILYTAVAQDTASQDLIGDADIDVSTPYLTSNGQADDLAAWMLDLLVEPTPAARQLVIDGRDEYLVAAILNLELGDEIYLQERAGGTVGTFVIQQMQITLANTGRLTGIYTVTRAPADKTIIFVVADDAETGLGEIALNDADAAAGVLAY